MLYTFSDNSCTKQMGSQVFRLQLKFVGLIKFDCLFDRFDVKE